MEVYSPLDNARTEKEKKKIRKKSRHKVFEHDTENLNRPKARHLQWNLAGGAVGVMQK